MEAVQGTTLGPVLWALPVFSHIRTVSIDCSSTDAMKNLLQLHPATGLSILLETERYPLLLRSLALLVSVLGTLRTK
jgi:hypothetical protein